MVLTRKIENDDHASGQMHIQGLKLTRQMNKLSQWFEENNREYKPELDDSDSRLIQGEIEAAMQSKCTVRIKSWKDHEFQYHIGTVKRVDTITRVIYYDDPFGIKRLSLDEIVEVMTVN